MVAESQEGLRIDIVETVVFKFGILSSWMRNTSEGVARQRSEETRIEAIRQSYVSSSMATSNITANVAIVRMKGRSPYLVHSQAFDELCTRLADRIECGAVDALSDEDMPVALQSFIAPSDDLRYITVASFQEGSPSCHIYQRKFSSYYLPLGFASSSSEASQSSVLGAVPSILKAQLEACTLLLVKHIATKHKIMVSKVVCEHIQDSEGKIHLLSIISIEYAAIAHSKEEVVPALSLDMNKTIAITAQKDMMQLSPRAAGVNVIPPWLQSPPTHLTSTVKTPRIFSASPKARSGVALEVSRPLSASPFSAAKKALGPVSYLTANGIHANNGSRPSSALTGAPAMIKRLADEVELLKDKLKAKDKELEAMEERLVQSELGRKKDLLQHETRRSDLRRQNDEHQDEIDKLKATAHELQCRAEIAEGKLEIVEKDRRDIRAEYQEEISAALSSLRSTQLASERNEVEVLRLNELLKLERFQLNGLTSGHSLSYDNGPLGSSALNDPSLSGCIEKLRALLGSQENPEGESYSVKKALHQYRGELQELFLYFSQLGSSARQWPPVLSYSQWRLFASELGLAESSKSTSSATHPRFSSSGIKKLSSNDMESIFLMHSDAEPLSLAINEQEPAAASPKSPQRKHSAHLTYASFLACLVQISTRLKPNPFPTDSLTHLLTLIMSKRVAARPLSPAKERPASPEKKKSRGESAIAKTKRTKSRPEA